MGSLMFDHLLDPGFLHAVTALLGPLAFFAAPTQEIEAMIFDHSEASQGDGEDLLTQTPIVANEDCPATSGISKAA